MPPIDAKLKRGKPYRAQAIRRMVEGEQRGDRQTGGINLTMCACARTAQARQ